MNTVINKISLLLCLTIIILSSCSRDEFNTLTPGDSGLVIDTIIVEEKVVVRGNGSITTFNGVYATCATTVNSLDSFTHSHFLAYGTDLQIVENEGVFDEPIFVLYWNTGSDQLVEGNYFTEGAFIDPNGTSEENLCYNLTITQVTPFSISGFFSSEESSTIQREGEFSTGIYSCESLGLDGEDLTEYTEGRLNISSNDGPEEVMMCAAVVCENLFADQPQTARLLVAGGKLYIEGTEELTIEENPKFMIIVDITQDFALNQTLNAYYVSDLDFLNSGELLGYAEFIALGYPISIRITSDKNGYLIGTFEGDIDVQGAVVPTNISGSFRAEFTTNCG